MFDAPIYPDTAHPIWLIIIWLMFPHFSANTHDAWRASSCVGSRASYVWPSPACSQADACSSRAPGPPDHCVVRGGATSVVQALPLCVCGGGGRLWGQLYCGEVDTRQLILKISNIYKTERYNETSHRSPPLLMSCEMIKWTSLRTIDDCLFVRSVVTNGAKHKCNFVHVHFCHL